MAKIITKLIALSLTVCLVIKCFFWPHEYGVYITRFLAMYEIIFWVSLPLLLGMCAMWHKKLENKMWVDNPKEMKLILKTYTDYVDAGWIDKILRSITPIEILLIFIGIGDISLGISITLSSILSLSYRGHVKEVYEAMTAKQS